MVYQVSSKTLTAQASCNRSFIAIDRGKLGSLYLGEAECAMRDLFCIAGAWLVLQSLALFLDEIDSIPTAPESTVSKGLKSLTR
jgi:SpoVK/Ycf46/Vps4 family AAA+-type ATPase